MTASIRVSAVTTLPMIIVSEFDEMPGMRLTMPQVQRLWALSAAEAALVVDRLVECGGLARDARGRVCRPDDLAP
jgi:hypothetical protein